MDNTLIKTFWNCGDNQLIEFALIRARLNAKEKQCLFLVLDECNTQEQAAEIMDISTRNFQKIWKTATTKLLNIPWVTAYATILKNTGD